MASETTALKTFRCEPRKRMEYTDAEAISALSRDLDEQLAWGAICDRPVTIDGWNVSHSSGQDFSVGKGQGLIEGELAKTISTQEVTLDANTDPSNTRTDLIELSKDDITDTDTDSSTEVVLSGITRTPVSTEAVGTGDDSTKAFSLATSSGAGGRVDINTLIVKIDGTKVAGWSLDWAANNIIFHDAPTAGQAITADYTYELGGVEASGSHNTRKERTPNFYIIKGTPGVPNTGWTSGSIRIAEVTVPASWSGGSESVTIDNTVKEFMIHPPSDVDEDSPGESPRSGRLFTPLRGIAQVKHGCRLQYVSSDNIQVTPGWGVMGGVSWRTTTVTELTLQTADNEAAGYITSTGWHYVYGIVSDTDSKIPGSVITLDVKKEQPDSLMRNPNSSRQGWFYIGAIYLTDDSPPTIRPFYTHGDRVFWQDRQSVLSVTLADPGSFPGTNDIDISSAVPATGRLLWAQIDARNQPASIPSDIVTVDVKSHKSATGQDDPRLHLKVPGINTAGENELSAQGLLRAEEAETIRYIHATLSLSGSPTNWELDVYVQGYVDDYRTIDESGAVSAY